MNNYLKAGNQIDIVYLLYGPKSFKNNLDEIYTYHYFLKPFYKEEYQPLFTENVNNQIHKIPYNRFRRIPYILTSNWAPEFVSKDEIGYTFLSPISAEYLLKIKELSIKHDFKLIIVPPPISFKKKSTIKKINTNEIAENNLSNEFKNYFKDIIYLNDSNFYPDGIHLKYPKIFTEYYIKKIYIYDSSYTSDHK